MILQLPNGNIIEVSVEQYLDMSEKDLQELNGLGRSYLKESKDPFYNLYSKEQEKEIEEVNDDIEPEFLSVFEDDPDILDRGVNINDILFDEEDIF
jgi:hypothetical protein